MWYRTGFLWGDLREGRKEAPLFGCAGRNMGTGWNLEVKNFMSFRRVRKITKIDYYLRLVSLPVRQRRTTWWPLDGFS